MPLPFLKQRKVAALIVQNRSADGGHDTVPEDHLEQELTTCGEDLIRGVTNKDAKAVGDAIRAAFEILDSEPHEEGPHTNESEEDEGESE